MPSSSQEDKISSANLLGSLVENFQTGILLEDENKKVRVVNKKFCFLFNLEENPEHFIGLDTNDLMHKIKKCFANEELFKHKIDEALFHQKPFLNEEFQLTDGGFYELNFTPIEDESKMNMWSFNDITINKRHEIVLNAEKEKYRNIIDKMNIGLIEVDVNNVMVLANQRVAEMSGYSVDYLIGKNSMNCF